MPSISFIGLQKPTYTSKNYTYSDLHLDTPNPITKDLVADYDAAAITNSIYSLFNTLPGQNLLNPQYGLNLAQYLFEPITQSNGNRIGKAILNGLTVYEPRVSVQNINIQMNVDEQTYYIELNILMPYLNNTPLLIPGVLSKSGYTLS
jgi:phage baseplate assembly protein W